MKLLDKILFETVAPRQVRYVQPPRYRDAQGLARLALDQMERDFVIGPPVTVHISNPELMTGMWSAARECLAAGQQARARGELIAATISRLNACPYCFDIHTSMLHSFGSHEAARSVMSNGEFSDPAAQAIVNWAKVTLQPDNPILLAPPFAPHEMPGILGTALCFHYLNRIANIFLDGSALMVKGEGWIKSEMTAMAGRMLRPRLTTQRVIPGEFLVPAFGSLPAEFHWAERDPNIAGGFLRFANAAEAAADESVSPEVRKCVLQQVAAWRGETPPLGRGWLERAIAPLTQEHRPAARLALLTVRAPYQIDEAIVSEFRATSSSSSSARSDRDLINLTAWSAFTAIRRIASWVAPNQLAPA